MKEFLLYPFFIKVVFIVPIKKSHVSNSWKVANMTFYYFNLFINFLTCSRTSSSILLNDIEYENVIWLNAS